MKIIECDRIEIKEYIEVYSYKFKLLHLRCMYRNEEVVAR